MHLRGVPASEKRVLSAPLRQAWRVGKCSLLFRARQRAALARCCPSEPRCDEQKRHLNAVKFQRNGRAAVVAGSFAVCRRGSHESLQSYGWIEVARTGRRVADELRRREALASPKLACPLRLAPLTGRDTEFSLLKVGGSRLKKEWARSCSSSGRPAWASLGSCRHSRSMWRRERRGLGSPWRIRGRGRSTRTLR